MKFRLLLAGLLIAASATTAMAAGPYVGVSGDLAIIHDSDVTNVGSVSYDVGGGFNINAGMDFAPARLEVEFGYKTADIDKIAGFNAADADVRVLSYMVNGYYDFKVGSPLVPYVGAGLGLVNGKISAPGASDDDTAFGYQVMLGVGYKATKNVTLDLSYRYQGSTDLRIDGEDVSYGSSNIIAGLRYNF